MSDRDTTIRAIRAALKRRSGKPWSVTGGTGTAWGWIRLDAPPAARTWRHVLPPGRPDTPEHYVDQDSGRPGGHMSPAARAELGRLLGLPGPVHQQGESIPSSGDYYAEYLARAEGRAPATVGVPYWD